MRVVRIGAVCFAALWLASTALAQDARYIKKLQKEAKNGDAVAQYKLGVAYADAYRVKRDYAKAIEWLSRAGNQGHAKAQLFLVTTLAKDVRATWPRRRTGGEWLRSKATQRRSTTWACSTTTAKGSSGT